MTDRLIELLSLLQDEVKEHTYRRNHFYVYGRPLAEVNTKWIKNIIDELSIDNPIRSVFIQEVKYRELKTHLPVYLVENMLKLWYNA